MLPWVEKYRPQTLDDIVGNVEAIDRMKVIAKEGNMPNMILSGPPGCGKTTSIIALARTLIGPTQYSECVLELNASDDRGIDVVRNKIKMFAHKKVSLPAGRHKIVILDEADSMTAGAQQALRRIMEVYSATTRFALACNFSAEVIEPIQSRCAIVRFSRLDDEQIIARLSAIARAEGVDVDKSGYETLLFTAEGDMRHAINALQAAHAGFPGTVTAETVYKVADQPHPELVKRAIELCVAGDFDSAHVIISGLEEQGYVPADIVTTIFKVIKSETEIMPEQLRLEFMREIGLAHVATSVEGINTKVQLAGLIARLCLKAQPKK